MVSLPGLDRERLNSHLQRLEDYVERLERIRTEGKERFLMDDLRQGATERYLQMAIETIINMGNHIIAARNLKPPQEYADVFRTLGEAGILDSTAVSRYVEMARFRNRLVHVYWQVDKEQVDGQ